MTPLDHVVHLLLPHGRRVLNQPENTTTNSAASQAGRHMPFSVFPLMG
jgi:hypothetical protein